MCLSDLSSDVCSSDLTRRCACVPFPAPGGPSTISLIVFSYSLGLRFFDQLFKEVFCQIGEVAHFPCAQNERLMVIEANVSTVIPTLDRVRCTIENALFAVRRRCLPPGR